MNDDRSYIEEHAGYVIWMASKLFASHEAIKYNSRVRERPALHDCRTNAPRVGRVSRAEVRVHDILCERH
jgi:hypothetical protein